MRVARRDQSPGGGEQKFCSRGGGGDPLKKKNDTKRKKTTIKKVTQKEKGKRIQKGERKQPTAKASGQAGEGWHQGNKKVGPKIQRKSHLRGGKEIGEGGGTGPVP